MSRTKSHLHKAASFSIKISIPVCKGVHNAGEQMNIHSNMRPYVFATCILNLHAQKCNCIGHFIM